MNKFRNPGASVVIFTLLGMFSYAFSGAIRNAPYVREQLRELGNVWTNQILASGIMLIAVIAVLNPIWVFEQRLWVRLVIYAVPSFWLLVLLCYAML